MPYYFLKAVIVFLIYFVFIIPQSHAQLKPMDKDYTPPPMFGNIEKPDPIEVVPVKPNYFKAPLPPKRPKSFKMSTDMLDYIQNRRAPLIKPLKAPNIGTQINNDTGNDIRIMNANDVLNSINR